MKKVITYGTYDLLHHGHIRLLERAKALGDYLIVGVTSDDYDKTRGKINIQQSLPERIEAVKATGLADLIIVEEYEGQKIDDIQRYDVDIFTVGSDWEGKFDYINEYCQVVYLERTEGISSSEIRSKKRQIKMGIVGNYLSYLEKVYLESKYVNGIEIVGICTDKEIGSNALVDIPFCTNEYTELLSKVDALFIKSDYQNRYEMIKLALLNHKSVLCESPMALSKKECEELFDLASENDCVLVEGVRTAYSTAYERLLLLAKTGKIGDVVSIDSTCTMMKPSGSNGQYASLFGWGANALLPVFQILGTEYRKKDIITHIDNGDAYSKINFIYGNATASVFVAEGAKSEGELVISGTKGYIYVPSPWWKTEYFEIRYENSNENKRYFYQLDGEGIRYALVAFCKSVELKKRKNYVSEDISISISSILEDFINKNDVYTI